MSDEILGGETLSAEQIWNNAMQKAEAGESEAVQTSLGDDDFDVVGEEREESVESTEEKVEGKKEESVKTEGTKKTFKVKDEMGEERSITLDINDDNLQKLVQKAKSAESIKKETESLRDQLSSFKEQMAQMKAAVEEANALKSLSPEEAMDKLYAKEGGYSAWLKKQHEEIERGANMTEDELRTYEFNKQQAAKDKEVDALRKKVDDLLGGISKKQEEAEQRELDSWVESATTKYSFSKVFADNQTKAQKWDRRVWAEAQKSLGSMQEQGVKLTPAIINKEIQAAYMDLKSDLVSEGESVAKAKIDAQKNKAAEAATTNFKKSLDLDVLEQEVGKALQANDEGKLRSLMNKAPQKVKEILLKFSKKK